jgi:RimJ/RimL family protein N-acetyltransferase
MKLISNDENTGDVELLSFDECRNDSVLKQQYLSWLNDRDVTKYLFRDDFYDTDKKMDYIDKSFERFTQDICKGFFINYLPLDKFVGTITLNNIDNVNKNLGMGIMLGEKSLWGKKIGEKSFQILMYYIFKGLNFHCIYGTTDYENMPMIKLFEKMSFQRNGIVRHKYFYDGKYRDVVLFSILDSEFNYCNLSYNYNINLQK